MRTSRAQLTLAVIVPTLDEAAVLPRLIESLSNKTDARERPDELIICDGGSRDGTDEVASSLGARVLQAPRGRGVQLARGASEAESDLLLFLHADTVVGPHALGALRDLFAERADVIATGMCQRIDDRAPFFRLVERMANLRVRIGRVYGDSGLAVRRSAYAAVGGFAEVPLFEDLDLSRRLRRHGRIALASRADLVVSPRRWRSEGALWRTMRNWALTAAWAAGVAPERLVRYYPPNSASAE